MQEYQGCSVLQEGEYLLRQQKENASENQINQEGFGKFSQTQGALRFVVPTHRLANTLLVIAFQNMLSIKNISSFQPANGLQNAKKTCKMQKALPEAK